jgi:hypothetical protein
MLEMIEDDNGSRRWREERGQESRKARERRKMRFYWEDNMLGDRTSSTGIKICRASQVGEPRVQQEPFARFKRWVLGGESVKQERGQCQ